MKLKNLFKKHFGFVRETTLTKQIMLTQQYQQLYGNKCKEMQVTVAYRDRYKKERDVLANQVTYYKDYIRMSELTNRILTPQTKKKVKIKCD